MLHIQPTRRLAFVAFVILVAALGPRPAAQSAPPPAPTVGVLTMLTVRPDVPRPDIMKVMPNEVRDTLKLYLEGKISQWFARADGRGVVFILNASTVEDVKEITDKMRLPEAGITTVEYGALTRLTSL